VNWLKGSKIKLATTSVVHAAHYIFSQLSQVEANEFILKVLNGDSLSPDEPAHLLRARLIDNLASKAKLQKYYILALFIKAWNYTRSGTKLKNLHYRTDGNKKESFPVAI
jgi:hypothetical protein